MVVSERRAELETLQAGFSLCETGRGLVTVVKGNVATGKSTLLRTFADRLPQAEVRILTARASRQEQHLPLGVIAQLLSDAALPEPVRNRAHEIVARARRDDHAPHATEEPPELPLGGLLLELASERPMMVSVDDAEFADAASLRCLQFVARRLDSTRIHLVLSTDHRTPGDYQRFETEIIRLPHFERIRLAPLHPDEVRAFLTPHLGSDSATRLAEFCYRLSGGNLALLDALLEECHGRADPRAERLEVGADGPYGESVVDCLRRCSPEVTAVARAVAALEGRMPASLVGDIVGLAPSVVASAFEVLLLSGVAEALRQPAAQAAVLADLSPAERRSLHARAAYGLNAEGAAASSVARQLAAAGDHAEPWAVPVLISAANHEISQGRPQVAVRHLELARQLSTDPAEQTRVLAMLAVAEWRVSPATAARHLPHLSTALRSGLLAGPETITIIRYLLWYGEVDEAENALHRLVTAATPADSHAAAELNLFRLWLTYFYPALLDRVPAAREALTSEISAATVAASPQLYAANLLHLLSANDSYDDIFDGAEYILHTCVLSAENLDPLITSLAALVYVDRLDTAAARCDALLAEAESREMPAWQGELCLIRAIISLRSGDLAGAVQYAERCLTLNDAKSWGVGIAGPLATLIHAYTAMGDHRAAAAVLRRPVPTEIFQTGTGLLYWQARGQHYLALGRLEPAASDFRACGELMKKWGLDLPGLVPWRTDLAQIYLKLGRTDEARDLIEEQLARSPRGRSRARGVALRLLAQVVDAPRRLALLRQAVEVLEACGAQLELALALDDLSRVYQEAEELERARMLKRRSVYLLKWCNVATPQTDAHYPRRPAVPEFEPVGVGGETSEADRLSEAERRVVAWAARGLTNREIARKLYITVSTVEQHLTRVYRKLNVKRRTDLPAEMQLTLSESA